MPAPMQTSRFCGCAEWQHTWMCHSTKDIGEAKAPQTPPRAATDPDVCRCVLQPASAQRGVLFDTGVMERVMYGSVAHPEHAAAAATCSSGPQPLPADRSLTAERRRQAMQPVSTPPSATGEQVGREEAAADALGGRTTRDWDSRAAEIQDRYQMLSRALPPVAVSTGAPARGSGGVLDLAALGSVGLHGDEKLRGRRSRSEGRPVRNVQVRHGCTKSIGLAISGVAG